MFMSNWEVEIQMELSIDRSISESGMEAVKAINV